MNELKILIIEDSLDDFDLLVMQISRAGYKVCAERVENKIELLKALGQNWDLVLSDNSLPQFNAPEALKLTRSHDSYVPFLIVSGTIGEEAAVEAMKSGANDYILKGNLKRLIPAIEREVRESKNRQKQIRIEQKLEESQKMYQFLSGSIQDVFIALDQKLNIVHWNEYAAKEFSTTGQLIGKNIFSVFPDWKKDIEKTLLKVLKDHKSQHISFEYKAKESFEGSVYPSEEGVSIIATKVTEQKKVKENLLRINNELETLMYRISHDLKGPVASIQGLINIGIMDFQSHDPVKSLLGMLDNSTLKLKHTLDDLLNITRIKQGQINPEEFILKDVLNEVIDGLKYYKGFEEIEIDFRLEDGHRLFTDQRLMSSVLQNLMENAIKYRSSYRASKVIISSKKIGGINEIEITDNGEGIEKKFQKHIFGMFYRANESSQGSGLGLYILKSALDKMDGSIILESEPGQGSSFGVTVPDWVS